MKGKWAPFMWGIALGVITMWIASGSLFGWVSSSTAKQLAEKAVNAAIVERFTPICVQRFNDDPNMTANREAILKMTSDWPRKDFIEKGGWSTFGGKSNSDLAEACGKALIAS